jgi:pSer/pThr/pTyr-binding forkhead associated (FHA) protein
MTVGRAAANTLTIRDDRVADHHVRIERDGGRYVLEVLAENASTSLNGVGLRPGERRTLRDGDIIGLADLEFRFSADRGREVLGRLQVIAGVHNGKTFRIDRSEARIGRATDNDVQFPDRSVSRHHCRIRKSGDTWWIEDLGSTNGTLVRGAPVRSPRRLQHGDVVVAGFSRFVFQEADRPLVNLNLEPAQLCDRP